MSPRNDEEEGCILGLDLLIILDFLIVYIISKEKWVQS